jgi:hypothetical protein
LLFSGPFPCIPGPPPVPTGRRITREATSRNRRLLSQHSEALEVAAIVAAKIMNYTNHSVHESDLGLASMLAIKLWHGLLEDPRVAFCGLYAHLDTLGGLDRAGSGLLALAASRLVYNYPGNLQGSKINCDDKNVTSVEGHQF